MNRILHIIIAAKNLARGAQASSPDGLESDGAAGGGAGLTVRRPRMRMSSMLRWAGCLLSLAGVAGAGKAEESVPPAHETSQFLGPNRNNDYGRAGILAAWPADGSRALWKAPAGEGYAAPAVADGRLYLFAAHKNRAFVRCLDAAMGRRRWEVGYAGVYKGTHGNGPRSTPLVHEGRVYTVGGTGMMHCLDAATGKVLWRKNILRAFHAENIGWGVSFSPLVEKNMLLISPGGPGASMVALDKVSGEVIWQSESDRAGYASPVAATIGGVRQAVFFTGSGLVAVRPEDGGVLWRYPWTTNWGVNATTPVISENLCLITSGYGNGCAVLELDGAGAKELWRTKVLGSQFSTPVVVGGHIYGFDGSAGSGTLKCVNLKTGTETWRQDGFRHGSLIHADGRLIVLGEKGELVLVDAAPDAYRERGRKRLPNGRYWTVPVLADGRLYVRSERLLFAFDVAAKTN